MVDSTTADLFDKATLLELFPGVLPVDAPASMTTALTTMLASCIDAANTAGIAGVTPLLAKIVLDTMSLICTNAAMWLVNDYNAAIAGQPPTAPIVSTPPAPADIVFSQPISFTFTKNGDHTAFDPFPGVSYPFTMGAMVLPSQGVADPGMLMSIETLDRRFALFLQNDGSVVAQAMDHHVADKLAIYGQVVSADVVDLKNAVLIAAVFDSPMERYVYTSRHGMSSPNTDICDAMEEGQIFTIGNDMELDHQFYGTLSHPFVVSRAMTAAELDALFADPTSLK